ncbi:MAG: hypothetical protein ACI8RD_002443 [Bacillariaceae sp.]|jgi:hypothetical protein
MKLQYIKIQEGRDNKIEGYTRTPRSAALFALIGYLIILQLTHDAFFCVKKNKHRSTFTIGPPTHPHPAQLAMHQDSTMYSFVQCSQYKPKEVLARPVISCCVTLSPKLSLLLNCVLNEHVLILDESELSKPFYHTNACMYMI